MNNKAYTKVEELINDQSFVNWVNKSQLSDIEFWNTWIVENPDKKEIVSNAKDIVLGIKFNKTTISEQKTLDAWEKLENRIKAVSNPKVIKLPFYKQRKYQSIAATVLLFLTISVFYFSSRPITVVHKTVYGEMLDLKLPDGTKVILNSNSELAYASDNNREITLSGEAFFDVEKKPATNAKFSVTTNDLTIEVFGTQFNVNNRNTKTQVFLEEGNIELLLNNGTHKKMIPGDLITYSYESDNILEEKRILRPELETSWKNGSLIFDRSSLEAAMQKIEDTYGVTVVFQDDASKAMLLTGAVPTQNLDICIKTIEKSAQVTIVNQDNKLYIHKN